MSPTQTCRLSLFKGGKFRKLCVRKWNRSRFFVLVMAQASRVSSPDVRNVNRRGMSAINTGLISC